MRGRPRWSTVRAPARRAREGCIEDSAQPSRNRRATAWASLRSYHRPALAKRFRDLRNCLRPCRRRSAAGTETFAPS